MASLLVTDGHWRKTLAVVRSPGHKGIHVTVAERTFLNTSFFHFFEPNTSYDIISKEDPFPILGADADQNIPTTS
jgi:hypothetical protein